LRGYGRVERAILDYLAQSKRSGGTTDARMIAAFALRQRPTPALLSSIRRALRNLSQAGLICETEHSQRMRQAAGTGEKRWRLKPPRWKRERKQRQKREK
jgi:Fe2+ or Zn2+ uptake regulation protein